MIVHDLDIRSARGGPPKAHPVLVVHPDAVLPGAVSPECLETIAWWYSKIIQSVRNLQLTQLAPRDGLDVHESLHALSFGKDLRVSALERGDHATIVTLCVINVKRDYSGRKGQAHRATTTRRTSARPAASNRTK